jgi:signal peptidase I
MVKFYNYQKELNSSYKVALDGKTPIDFEYLLKEMDVTDPVMLLIKPKEILCFSALTAASAERLKNIPGITGVPDR